MEQITSLNNEAIQLFQTGKHQQAVRLLSELLTQLKVILSSSTNTTTIQQEGSSSQAEQALPSSSLLFAAEPLASLPPRCNFIYNKLFKISSKSSSTTTDTNNSIYCHIFTACVIYNLAMIHHHLGLTMTTTSSVGGNNNSGVVTAAAFLQKAENLYQMCIRILEGTVNTTADILDLNTIVTVHLLKAVSYNNLAQLYMDGNHCQQMNENNKEERNEQARNCLFQLHNLVTLIDEVRGGNVHGQQINENDVSFLFSNDDYDGIIENILLLRPPTMAAAA